MLDRLIPIPLPRKAETDFRDGLLDRLQAKSFDELVKAEVDLILASGENAGGGSPAVADPALARSLRLLAAAHSREELTDIVTRGFLAVLHRSSDSFDSDGDVVDGGEPFSSTVVGAFVIGVAAGIAAAWIYDEFIEGNETYTTTITDSNGTNWEIVTDENGRVISIQRIEDGGSGP